MYIRHKKLQADFYKTAGGTEPVREWLKELSQEDRRTVGQNIADVEYGWPVGMPVSRSLGNELWEVRSNISHGRIARVIFYISKNRMILLHGFIKKTRKTPKQDIDTAIKRKNEVKNYEQ